MAPGKRVLKPLPSAADHLDLVMRAINEGVYDYEIASDKIRYSPRIYEVLDVPRAKLRTAADWRKLIHPEDLPAYLKAFADHVKGKSERFALDHRYLGRKGWRWARQSGMAARDAKGRAVRVIGSIGDITALKRTEEALRASERRYDVAMRAINEGVYEWDIATGKVYYSDRVRDVLGLTRKELGDAGDWLKRIHPEDLERYRAAHRDHFKGLTERFECDYRYRARDGSWRWSRTHGMALRDAAGRAVRMIGSTGDITELKRAEERQAATAEILKAIASSPSDVQPVFDAIAERAAKLCDASFAFVTSFDGELVHLEAFHGISKKMDAMVRAAYPVKPGSAAMSARVIEVRAPVVIPDVLKDPAYGHKDMARKAGFRCGIGVPLMRGDRVLGAIVVARPEAGPIPDEMVALLQTFADQAVIAIENVRLFNETKEALARQTASADILRVISRSPEDVQPVFQAIVTSGQRLLSCQRVAVLLRNADHFDAAAWFDSRPQARAPMRSAVTAVPIDPAANFPSRVFVEKRMLHLPDWSKVELTPHERRIYEEHGWRASLMVPLMRDEACFGVLTFLRSVPVAFTDNEIALGQSFADQAVIAIENVRLFKETKEALERQTATAEILKVIASSPSDVQPVFDAIVASATRLIDGFTAAATRVVGESLHLAAFTAPKGAEWLKSRFPVPLDRPGGLQVQVVRTGEPYFFEDTEKDSAISPSTRQTAREIGFRSIVGVPMLRNGVAIGALAVTRREPGPFSTHEIGLLRTFADQAVIAIENVRLFNETKEALERQTATAEILKVVAGSPSDVQPVFEAIAASALKLVGGRSAVVARCVGDELHLAAYTATTHAGDEALKAMYPMKLTGQGVIGQAVLSGQPAAVADFDVDTTYSASVREMARARGTRSMLAVPMLRDGKSVGAINVTRGEPGAFSEAQVGLLRTFADQAVIAIENVRLFNETKEALERQTATAEILKVISSSPTDEQPVFDAIVASAARLFGRGARIRLVEGDKLRLRATSQHTRDAEAADVAFSLTRDNVGGRVFQDRRPHQVVDTEAADAPSMNAERGRIVGYRSIAVAPLMREGAVIGVIAVTSPQPGALDEKQMALLQTFADQAVIAIQNVRLFKELQQRVRQLTALGEVGHAISSTLDLATVLKSIVSRAVQLTGMDGGTIYEFQESTQDFHLRAGENMPDEMVEVYRAMPIRLGEGIVGKAAITREPVQVPDIRDEGYQTRYKELLLRQGYLAILAVPLVREDQIVGALTVNRSRTGAFPPEVIELLKTFATQSALAIQNARLFREIAEKGKQLEVASQHKSQFLASMSHELRTPLNALLGFNEMLLGNIYGEVPEDMKPPLAQMQTSGKHLLRLINNVLDLAKIEAGRMELALSDYSVHDTVESVRSTLHPLAAEKGLDLRATVPPDIPLARGDPGRIAQCLMNLAGNSLKFTKAGKVEISVALDNGNLRYSVADTGIGIPPDKMEGLFTEFKQTDATIASEYGGTGLGLSISRKFVEMHGGRIWAESGPGRGAAFHFEIPLRMAE